MRNAPHVGAAAQAVAPTSRSLRDPLAVTRRLAWWVLVVSVVLAPTIVAAQMGAGSILDSPMTLFSLSFEIQAVLVPLIAVALYVVPISEQFTDGWTLYTRTREDLRGRLRRLALRSAVVPGAALAAAAFVSALYAFYLGPFGAAGAAPSSSDFATLTQLTEQSGMLYIVVVCAAQGLWAAVFSLVGLGLLLLTGRRAVAFAIPLVLYWVDNAILGALGLEAFRTVSSIDPFTVTQAPMWTAAIPLLWWGGLLVVIGILLRRRLGDAPALQ